MSNVDEFLKVSGRIESEYETALALLKDPEVIKVVSFLSELDKLAGEYDFTPMDIMTLLDPGRAIELKSHEAKNERRRSKRVQRS